MSPNCSFLISLPHFLSRLPLSDQLRCGIWRAFGMTQFLLIQTSLPVWNCSIKSSVSFKQTCWYIVYCRMPEKASLYDVLSAMPKGKSVYSCSEQPHWKAERKGCSQRLPGCIPPPPWTLSNNSVFVVSTPGVVQMGMAVHTFQRSLREMIKIVRRSCRKGRFQTLLDDPTSYVFEADWGLYK